MSATRDSTPVRLAGYLISTWSVFFAISCILVGDRVTSPQWQYLMSIPGGKWSWAVMFGVSGLISIVGLRNRQYLCICIGECATGTFCLLIAVFYAMAPLIADKLITLGSWPWILSCFAAIGVGAMNRNDREW